MTDNLSDRISFIRKMIIDCCIDYEEVVHDSEAMFAFSHIFWELEAIFHQELDVKEVIEFYGKVLVNSFAIQDEVMQPIGRAVYLG